MQSQGREVCGPPPRNPKTKPRKSQNSGLPLSTPGTTQKAGRPRPDISKPPFHKRNGSIPRCRSQAVRELISRKLNSAKYTKSVPGAPDGEYVILQFSTSFANKKEAVETVTPMLDKDGKWKVSGYYIK